MRRISVTAPDGVEIVGAASGEGPGLALVYGAMMEQQGWARLLPHLQAGRSLYTYDRRGRGGSGNKPGYAVEREVDDLLAFLGALPLPLDLFGHSSGALLALRAAVQGAPVQRLVLYEPPLAALREPRLLAETPPRIIELVEAGDRGAALELFMREGMLLGNDDMVRVKASERWQDQLRYAETGAYDIEITRTYVLRPEQLSVLNLPALFLVGDRSPAWMRRGVETFAETMPNARLEVIEGHGHNAQFSAPEALAAKMRSFLD